MMNTAGRCVDAGVWRHLLLAVFCGTIEQPCLALRRQAIGRLALVGEALDQFFGDCRIDVVMQAFVVAAKVGAQVCAQLGAAAVNAINWSTSISFGQTTSVSNSTSNSTGYQRNDIYFYSNN